MKNNLSQYVQEWFDKAGDDELSIRALIDYENGAPGTVCFLSQQMAEKYLKGLMAYKGEPFKKVHDLVELSSVVFKGLDKGDSELLEAASYLNRFYIETRYPGDYPDFNWDEARKSFSAAEEIKKKVLSIVGGE